jgi:signal transduction histidine kinase
MTVLHRVRSSFVAALSFSLVIALLATAAGVMAADRKQDGAHRQFDQRVSLVTAAVSGQIDRYIAAMTLVAAGLGSTGAPTASSFDAVTASIRTLALPGAGVVAFVVPARASAVAATQRYWRRRGASGLVLRPGEAGPEHLFSVFSRPLDGSAATVTGGDGSRSAEAAAAMDAARASGRITVSSAYRLLRDRALPPAQRQLSFVLAAPVRGRTFLGWVVLGLRGQDFVGTVLREISQSLVDVTLLSHSASGARVTVARLTAGDGHRRDLREIVPVARAGWTLEITATAARLPGAGSRLPLGIGLAGVLIAGLVFVLATGRTRADRRLIAATAGLSEQRADLAAFAGVVAHDLKSPLAAIVGFAHLAVRGAGNGEAAGHLRQVIDAAGRMNRLIEHLLDYAAAQEARLILVDVDLQVLVDEVVQARQAETGADPAAAAAQVVVGPLPRVRADEAMVRQLLDNVIGNSFKYARPDRPVRIEITAESAPVGRAAITVADRGVGIPEGRHEAVFGGFYRASSDPALSGSGLGLAICQRIVDRHGGTITAADNPGGGTQITFTLPIAAAGERAGGRG